jgi:hypothetical protein
VRCATSGSTRRRFLKATRGRGTVYATGLVDLQARRVIDMVEGNSAADLRKWTAKADRGWLAGIEVVATDLAESFRAGLSPHLPRSPPTRRPQPPRRTSTGNRTVKHQPRQERQACPATGHVTFSVAREDFLHSFKSGGSAAGARPAGGLTAVLGRRPSPIEGTFRPESTPGIAVGNGYETSTRYREIMSVYSSMS